LMLLLFDNIWEVYKSTHETHKVRNIELNWKVKTREAHCEYEWSVSWNFIIAAA
jgi:hypothetical protein